MAPKAPQIPGAPAADTPQADDRDAEIAKLRAELAAARAPAAPAMIMEADGPNIRRYIAESKHRDFTAAELHAKVMAGEVKLTDHHVLCKDGWYVNPAAQKQANG